MGGDAGDNVNNNNSSQKHADWDILHLFDHKDGNKDNKAQDANHNPLEALGNIIPVNAASKMISDTIGHAATPADSKKQPEVADSTAHESDQNKFDFGKMLYDIAYNLGGGDKAMEESRKGVNDLLNGRKVADSNEKHEK